MSDASPGAVDSIPKVLEYAEQAVAYVRRSLGMTLEYDSNTLPILDHYLRTMPRDRSAATELVALTSGAYFGEVIRRALGGRWVLNEDPKLWRMVLPAGLEFAPAGLAAAAIAQADLADLDTELDAPARMKTYVQQALERMGGVSEEAYYSLSGRMDTIEHLHEVLVTVAAQLLGDAGDSYEGEAAGSGAGGEAEAEKEKKEPAAGEADSADGADGADGADEDEEPTGPAVKLAKPAKLDDGLN